MRIFRNILLLLLLASAVPTAVLGWLLATAGAERLAAGGLLLAAVGAVVALGLAAALAAWFARGIVGPIEQVVHGALEIARGRFGYQIEFRTGDALGDLAYTFNHMSRELQSQDAENRRLITALETGYLDTIRSLAGAIDAKDAYTRGHNQRVAELSVEIGRELGLEPPALKALEYGGILHDVGKIGVPEQVLKKDKPLTPEEMEVMRQHPAIGAEIVRGVDFLREAGAAIRSHHERWDGAGYPDGLAGEAIPLVARIVNIADTWDACTTTRPYQPALSNGEAMAILERLRGSQIDPRVHDALLAALARRERTSAQPAPSRAAGA
jgi:putative nucleotidyltransferase with HDIG domain